MNPVAELLAFAGVMALGQFSPGPDMILLTRTALRSGGRAGVKMALGIACGLSVHATFAVGGLALAFERSPVLRGALRWVAAVYLMWLAYRILRETIVIWNSKGVAEPAVYSPVRKPFLRGLFCNLLNPKAALFLAAVSTPFLSGDRPGWWPFVIWGIVVGQAGLLWSSWACLLQWKPLRSRYEAAARWIDGAFGVALAALAIRLMIG
jgi:threonine/homoserine/homoserine lactone efflux protein